MKHRIAQQLAPVTKSHAQNHVSIVQKSQRSHGLGKAVPSLKDKAQGTIPTPKQEFWSLQKRK